MRDVWSLVAQTSVARIYWTLATLVVTTITARYLGPEGRGVYAAAVGWVMLFAAFGHLSLSQVTIYLAAGKPPAAWLPSLLGTLLAIVGAVTLIGWTFAAALHVLGPADVFRHLDATVLVLAFLGLPALLWIEVGNGVLMALGRLPVMNAALIAGITVSALLTLLALGVLTLGVPGALVATLLGQIVTVAIALRYTARGTEVRVSPPVARALLTGSARLHLNTIGSYLFTPATVLIVNHYSSASDTAYFQLAMQLVVGLQVVATSVSAVTYSLVSTKGPDAAWPEQRRLLLHAIGLVSVFAVIAYFVAPFAVRLVFGSAFLPTVPLFRILLLGTVGMTMSAVMASQWIARGLFVQAALLTLIVGAVTVSANYVAVPSHGAYGAAWVTVATYAISIVGNGGMALWVERRSRDRQAAITHPA